MLMLINNLLPSFETLKRLELSMTPLGMVFWISHDASNPPSKLNRQIFSRSWQKIDLPSGAQVTDHHPKSSEGNSRNRKARPSALTKASRQRFSTKISNVICAPSGDQTGPKQLSLGVSLKKFVSPVAISATAI